MSRYGYGSVIIQTGNPEKPETPKLMLFRARKQKGPPASGGRPGGTHKILFAL